MNSNAKHSTQTLPDGYSQILNVNLQKDKKTALIVNIASLAVIAVMGALAHFAFVPLTELLSYDQGFVVYFIRLGVLIAALIAYMVLHELTHAAAMKTFGGGKVRFGYTGLYAYAGSEHDFFDKPAYITTALAPLVVWGIVFTVLLIFVPRDWFWVAYFLQIANISGAAGDLYVTFKFLPMPKSIMVKDTGLEMFVFDKKQN